MSKKQAQGYLSQDLLVNRLNQIGTQASLIGGFAFAGITSVQDDPAQTLNWIVPYFTIISAASVGLNVLAITLLTLMNVTIASARIHPEDQKSVAKLNKRLKFDYYVALFAFLLGLLAFLVSLMFIIYLRMTSFAAYISTFAILIPVSGLCVLFIIRHQCVLTWSVYSNSHLEWEKIWNDEFVSKSKTEQQAV